MFLQNVNENCFSIFQAIYPFKSDKFIYSPRFLYSKYSQEKESVRKSEFGEVNKSGDFNRKALCL